MKNDFFGLRHPFFIPLWRRLLTVAACLIWATFEFWAGSPGWGMLFGGVGAIAAWGFFVDFDPEAIRANADKAEKDKKNG
jgi:hypothetical protein